MALAKGFQSDVFVSYATANNHPLAEGKPGWVTALRDALRAVMPSCEFWMDYKLRGNEPFGQQLIDRIQSSATLLIVLSEQWLNSQWCRRELEHFLAATADGVASGRIFLVHFEPVPPEQWPQSLHGLSLAKYRFFHQQRDGAITLPLGFPIPNPENAAHHSYYERLLELRAELSNRLKRFGSAPLPTSAAEASGALTSPPPTSPTQATRLVVFLAQVSSDTLYDQRQRVQSHLEQAGLRVVPTTYFSADASTVAAQIDEQLVDCRLFVQMFGRFRSPYDAVQFERATAAGLPVFRWRGRDLDLETVPDPEHRAQLSGPDVEAMDFEEFKQSIVERVRVIEAGRGRDSLPDDPFVVIRAAQDDYSAADAIADQLSVWEIGYDIVDESISLRDVAEAHTYDAFIVIYGSCPYAWIREQLIQCRELMLIAKDRAPKCAVFVAPVEHKQPLRCRPPRIQVFDGSEPQDLRRFLASKEAGGAST